MLLETTVRSLTPLSRTASMRSRGTPESPNPPTASVIPSRRVSASSSAALSLSLDMATLSHCVHV